jgi:hypothetical protein
MLTQFLCRLRVNPTPAQNELFWPRRFADRVVHQLEEVARRLDACACFVLSLKLTKQRLLRSIYAAHCAQSVKNSWNAFPFEAAAECGRRQQPRRQDQEWF